MLDQTKETDTPQAHRTCTTLVVGATGGIGRALVEQLGARAKHTVIATGRRERPSFADARIHCEQLDATDEAAVADLFSRVGSLDQVILAQGLLHSGQQLPEKTIRRFDPQFFLDTVTVNTLPALLVAKYAAPAFKGVVSPRFVALSARVGSITDNQLGGWYSYRASKAALNMVIKTLSIEWQRSLDRPIVAALHPGTVATGLSEPFQRGVPPEKLFTPEYSAERLLKVLGGLTASDNGGFFAWDGAAIPW
jgi:NAD(P)-dependent dehydrogenase (short-subunit alcohol dehydrogenase family)